MMARVSAPEKSGPWPTNKWYSRFCWGWACSSSETRKPLNGPKPVLMPYTARGCAATFSTSCRLRRTNRFASSANWHGDSKAAACQTSAMERVWPLSSIMKRASQVSVSEDSDAPGECRRIQPKFCPKSVPHGHLDHERINYSVNGSEINYHCRCRAGRFVCGLLWSHERLSHPDCRASQRAGRRRNRLETR